MCSFDIENLSSNKPNLYFGLQSMLASVWFGMTGRAVRLLTLEVMKYEHAINRCWTPVRHVIYDLEIMKILHLAPRRDSINPGFICYL